MIQFGEDLGAVVVVGEDRVSDYTAQGYQLKAVVSETTPQPVFPVRGHLNPPAMPGSLGMITSSPDTEYLPLVVTKYILGLPKDETARRHFEDCARLMAENEALQTKVKQLGETEKHLGEALKTCKAFVEEREALEKRHAADKAVLEIRVKALTENSQSCLADFKRLADSDPLQRILSLEDWILKAGRVIPLAITEAVSLKLLEPVPVSGPKTWAERLVEDTDL